MNKMKSIIGVCTLLLLFLCGCNAEDSIQQELPAGTIGVRLVAMGMAEGETSNSESVVNEIEGFRFEDGMLREVFDRLSPDTEGVCHLQPLQMRGTVYFLANASDIVQKADLQVAKTTLEEFLDLQATASEMTASGIVMSGQIELSSDMTSASVILKRSVSRIDLDSPFEGVKVNNVKISNILSVGYVNERQSDASSVNVQPETIVKDFGDTPFQNNKQTLFYLCEQKAGTYEVELMVTSNDGAWHRLKTTFTALNRNTIYTLKVYGNGADLRVEVLVDDWENGVSSESGQVLKSLIDKAASELSEGVEINERGDTVFIPYEESNFRLVLKAEEEARLMVNGMVEGVTIASQSSSRSMEPFAEVVVESHKKMPGSVQGYIYLDVYKQMVQIGRIVLVFRPNPIGLSGKLEFDSDAVCDFARYVDGELGSITLPEGKKI